MDITVELYQNPIRREFQYRFLSEHDFFYSLSFKTRIFSFTLLLFVGKTYQLPTKLHFFSSQCLPFTIVDLPL